MTPSRRLLVFGGIALAAFGMLYGLHYALFVEHQTLDRMGASLSEAFVRAAPVLFPLGVILQTSSHGSVLGSALAIVGSGLVTLALAAAAWGFTRQV